MKEKRIIVVLTILLVIALGFGGFFGYKYFTDDKDNNTNTKANTSSSGTENLDINDSTVQNLYKIFGVGTDCYRLWDNININNSNLARLRIAYQNIDFKYVTERECGDEYKPIGTFDNNIPMYCGGTSKNMGDMSEEMGKYYAKKDIDGFTEAAKTNKTEFIASKDLESKYKELFSSKYEYKSESFGILHPGEPESFAMIYNADVDGYAHYQSESGDMCGGFSEDLVSAYKDGNYLYIKTKIWVESPMQTKNRTYKFVLENGNYLFYEYTDEEIK